MPTILTFSSISNLQSKITNMGLQNQLNDVSSESIPLLLIALIASFVAHLRSLFGSRSAHHQGRGIADDEDGVHLGSGLTGLIVLAEQLKLNRLFSYRYCCASAAAAAASGGADCVVCLCTVRDGERVRRLECRHVFHKECFDGWLHHLNFNCPLCRSPLVAEERVDCTRRRVGGELESWFSFR